MAKKSNSPHASSLYEDFGNAVGDFFVSVWHWTIELLEGLGKCLSDPELVKAYSSYAWPLFILIVVIILKNDIAKTLGVLSERISEATKDGVKFREQQPNNQAPGTQIEAVPTANIPPAPTPAEEPAQRTLTTLNEALRGHPLILQYVDSGRALIDNWIRQSNLSQEDWFRAKLAELSIQLVFEKVRASIYSQQYKALYHLEKLNGTAARALIETFYDLGATRGEFDKNTYSYFQWLNYLHSFRLISSEDNNISLTPEGSGFLRYMEENYPFIARNHTL